MCTHLSATIGPNGVQLHTHTLVNIIWIYVRVCVCVYTPEYYNIIVLSYKCREKKKVIAKRDYYYIGRYVIYYIIEHGLCCPSDMSSEPE